MLDPDASPLRVAPSRLAALLVAVLGPLLLAAPLALGSPAGAASPVASPVASPAAAAGPAPYGVPAVALDDEETGAPLTVRIDGVTPDVGVLAAGSVVTVTGTITNASEDTWSDLQVFPVTSRSPLTTTAELDEAAATDPLEFVGERLLVDGLFDESITSLPPGESRPYRLDLPVEQLQIDGTPGVYWLAVHALGADADGVRSGNALGRARTFLPLLDPARAAGTSARAGVVVPLRHPVRYAEDGSIADPESWSLLLGREGRLRRIVDLLAPDPTGATGAVSLLLDPALLDVARRLAEGNPPRSLAPTSTATGPTEEPGTAGTDDPTPTDAPTESPIGRDEGELEVADGPVAEAAAAWLEDVLAAASAGDLLVLPYGDVDLGAAATHDPIAYGRARLLADDALARYGLTGTPAVAPRGEGLPDGIVDAVEEGALVLVGDDRLPEDAPEELSAGAPLAEADGRDVVVVDDALAEGGPSPGERTTGLAVRQRLASALVVDALADGA
ncbi:MAG TPA: DUF6049 family protein, partial [Nocardioides sp.]